MSEFSATEAAFEGFRVARERPWAIVAWAGVALAMLVAQQVLISYLGDVKALEEFQATIRNGMQPTPGQTAHLVSSQLPYLAAIIPILLLYYGIMFAAAFRVVIEPDSSKNGLQVGVQELRQTWLIIVISVVLFIAYIGVLFFGGALVGLAAQVNKPLAAMFGFLATLALFAFFLVVPIRLSLAGPQTFSEHRLRPFNSWSLTRGRFWPITGAYVLATVFAGIVWLLGLAVLTGVAALFGLGGAKPPAPETLASYFSPLVIIGFIGMSILWAMTWAILACPAAVIYEHISRGERR